MLKVSRESGQFEAMGPGRIGTKTLNGYTPSLYRFARTSIPPRC